ncbi:MAG: hypothetical protein PUI24_03020 [Spirochaetales bacterium]|nr:hypothetical protein [Spirochaetia bacterium]MDD7013937.1 hypothetical protein [Spirochaetales bacterium]
MFSLVAIAVFLIIFNLIMWIIFAFKFKKIFSTDDIMNKTRNQINGMLTNLSNHTGTSISVIEDRIEKLKAICADAERKVEFLRSEIKKAESTKVFQEKLAALSVENSVPKKNEQKHSNPYVNRYKNEQLQVSLFSENDINQENKGERLEGKRLSLQTDSLHSEPEHKNETEDKENYLEKVHQIPVIEPEVFLAENPVKIEKNISATVKELLKQGFTIEEIASKTKRSIQEIQFLADFD